MDDLEAALSFTPNFHYASLPLLIWAFETNNLTCSDWHDITINTADAKIEHPVLVSTVSADVIKENSLSCLT
jgi:hypothetical protein